jgi:hypothetical protein
MKFEKYNIKNIGMHYKRSNNMKLLDDFKKSGLKCAVVTEWETKTSQYCASSLQLTIKRYHEEYGNILCIHRNGKVILINEAVNE